MVGREQRTTGYLSSPVFPQLSRILYSTNIVKGESREKGNTRFHNWALLSRILYSTNIVKGESRTRETQGFTIGLC